MGEEWVAKDHQSERSTYDLANYFLDIVEELATSLFFKNKESFEKAVEEQRQKPLHHEQIGILISNLYTKEDSKL